MIPYYIKKNTPELREKLEKIGYRICSCCLFEDNIWLNIFIYEDRREIHGIGSYDDSFAQSQQEALDRFIKENTNAKECDEEEFIRVAKELINNDLLSTKN